MPILPFEKHRLDLPPHRICAPRSLRPRYSYIDMASSSNSPCAACKFLRRKCTAECVFAPYFPPDQPHKFANVHKIFGASNITKLLNELPPHQREDAVNSLAYEADARVKDPVYGCVGAISVLQRHVAQLQQELAIAHSDLARYTGAGLIASPSMQQQPGPSSSLGIGMGLTISPSAVRERMYTARDQIPTRDQQLISRDLQLLELQRETQLTREQILDQLARSSGGSYDTGLATFGMTGGMGPYPSRTGSEGRSGGGPGSMGHLSPP